MCRSVWLAVFLSALAPGLAQATSYGSIGVGGGCLNQGGDVFVQWTVEVDPSDTSRAATWYGFDVYRRDMASCGPWVRVTASSIPRIIGPLVTLYSLYDTPPENHAWDYQVRFVAASGAEVSPFDFCYCLRDLYTSCPWRTTPVVEGTLATFHNGGAGIAVSPCPGSCYPGVPLDTPLPDDLVPLVDTGAIVRLYGTIGCGTEGCSLYVTNHEMGSCGALPVRATSWGRLKSIFR